MISIRLYNSLGRAVQEFTPIETGKVKIYTCGPTVYDYQHIGNYSGYIYWDILVRLLQHTGLAVERVMNITDVGHLVSDSDDGEDKLEKGAKREGKTSREVADFYTADFIMNTEKLNLVPPKHYAKATNYIAHQVEIIQLLIEKGFAYQTDQALYFDVTRLSDYGKLSGQKLEDKDVGVRDDVIVDKAKHHPHDFALWFFTVGRFVDHEMRWDSPWGSGFPGWHLECSAIIHAILGEPIDIHCGGVDHIGTHHTNEIAQSEAAFGKDLAKFWLHNNHMSVDGQKISKSLANGYRLEQLEDKGFGAQDFRLFVLQSHYRSQSKFTWEALDAAKSNLAAFNAWADLAHQSVPKMSDNDAEKLITALSSALLDDLNTPNGLAVLHAVDKSLAPSKETLSTLDELLGFEFSKREDISSDQKRTIALREQARSAQNWQESDRLRDELATQHIVLNDGPNGTTWQRQI